jgi:hypothetical protein
MNTVLTTTSANKYMKRSWSLGQGQGWKCKSKRHWDSVSLRSEWVSSRKKAPLARTQGERSSHTAVVRPLWSSVRHFLKKLKTGLPHNPAMPLLGLCPKECKPINKRETCTAMLPAALHCSQAGESAWRRPCQARGKADLTCFRSFVESRPKMVMMVIGH